MKYAFKIAIGLWVLVLLNACKKYEQGPSFSLRSARARLTGDYNVGSLTVDGADSTAIFNQLNYNPWFRFERVNRFNQLWTPNDIVGFGGAGDWMFISNKDSLDIRINNLVKDFGPLRSNVLTYYRILKLTKKQCILRKHYNSKVYVLMLDKR